MNNTSKKNVPIKYCGTNGHIKYAGVHLLVELWGAKHMDNLPIIKQILKDAVDACEATLLTIDLHKFSPEGGVSGMAILQESHMSIHTWVELEYVALDIFLCGSLDPYKAIPVIKRGFKPDNIQIVEIKRGIFS